MRLGSYPLCIGGARPTLSARAWTYHRASQMESTTRERDPAERLRFGWDGSAPREVGEQLSAVDFTPLIGLPPPSNRMRARELRVLAKALRRDGLQLEPSFLWRAFLSTRPRRDRLLYRAFTLNDALTAGDWIDLLGERSFDSWRGLSLLAPIRNGNQRRARIIHTGRLALLLDDLGDQREYAYCGRDSLALLGFCLGSLPGFSRGRYLDVGIGAGPLLCGLAPHFETALGIDINPRAVQLTRANVRLNKLGNARAEQADVFDLRADRYDVVTWNVPYMFLPEHRRRACNDGGDLGIGLTIRFLGHLPELLSRGGVAVLMTSSPRLTNGRKPLGSALIAAATGSDLNIQVFPWFSLKRARNDDFLRSKGISATDVVILVVRQGGGRVDYRRRPVMERVLDYGMRP